MLNKKNKFLAGFLSAILFVSTALVGVSSAPKRVTIKSAKLGADGNSVKITIKKFKGAKGYQIRYGYKKNLKGAKVKFIKKRTVTLKKLTAGKTLYIKVRAKLKKGYSKYSKIKSVKLGAEEDKKFPPAPQLERATLIVRGEDLSHLNLSFIDYTNKCARIPIVAVARALGASVDVDADEVTIQYDMSAHYVFYKDRKYNRSCMSAENFIKMPEGVTGEPYYIPLDGEFIVDTHSTYNFITNILDAKLTIDYENKIIKIGMHEKINDPNHKDAILIVNDKTYYYDGYTTVSKQGDSYRVPMLRIIKDLGGEVTWVADNKGEIVVDGKKYILNIRKKSIYPEGSSSYNYIQIPGCPCDLFCERVYDDCIINSVHVDMFINEVLGAEISVDYKTSTITVKSK